MPGARQEALAQERGGKARIVASLRETIAGLRAAGDVEGRLQRQLAATADQLAAAQAAQVCAHPLGHPCDLDLVWELER